ncbi:MAG TPA: type II toxin-antitoxin system VapC family toxin [Solirubrobacteraceae bacterium]|nr:type II toxin-antitoxin system VapC family toxin [Solirubrobacteraceae bacterium]
MIVVDASVLAPALAYDVPEGDVARARLDHEEQLFAPEIVDLELAAVWRHAVRAGRLDERRSARALDDLAALRLVRAGHQMLMPRVWELRHNLTPYDAAYVALAEALDATLLTADARSTRAPSLRCGVELLR